MKKTEGDTRLSFPVFSGLEAKNPKSMKIMLRPLRILCDYVNLLDTVFYVCRT